MLTVAVLGIGLVRVTLPAPEAWLTPMLITAPDDKPAQVALVNEAVADPVPNEILKTPPPLTAPNVYAVVAVGVRFKVALLTTAPVLKAPAETALRIPVEIVVPPVWVFAPERVWVPAPVLVSVMPVAPLAMIPE